MAISRRSFVRALGIGGAAAVAVRGEWLSARGREALAGTPLDQRDAAPLASGVIRLSSNENPNGPGPAVLEAIRGAFDAAPRYPGGMASAAQAALARHYRVAEDSILVGCGSGEVLRMAAHAFVGPGRALVTALPSFEDPVMHARTAGAEVVEVPVDARLRLDLDAMAKRAPGAGLIFFCNPNNPTGTVHGASDVRAFIEQVGRSSDAVVLVDEAYHEYVEEPAYATAIPLALENPRVIVARTFSKVYGLAGVRVGYAVGRPEALSALRRHRLPNSVNALGAAAAVAALEQPGSHLDRERRLNQEARAFTRRALEELGYPSPASHANFIMVDVRRSVQEFIAACRRERVAIGRPFPPLSTHARISVGTMEEMRAAVDVFRRVLTAGPTAGG